jgi:hypothetical protein
VTLRIWADYSDPSEVTIELPDDQPEHVTKEIIGHHERAYKRNRFIVRSEIVSQPPNQ